MRHFTIALTLLVAMSALGARSSWQPVHFMIVDDSGRPMPGVKVTLSWYINGGRKSWKKELISDKDGRFCSDGSFPGDGAHIMFGWKGGYSFDGYLNGGEYVYESWLNRGRGWYSWASGSHTKDNPCKVVLRKRLSEQGMVFCPSVRSYKPRLFRRGEKGEPLPLCVVSKPGDKEPHSPDCFALPEFDEVKKVWKCTFWTTNVNGGVLATTNRVFIAPSTGYQKRVEVSMDMCCSPSFTLYVKTYDPLLYAMFWMHGFGTKHGLDSTGAIPCSFHPDSDKPFAGIEIDRCCYNVFGERCLERDLSVREILDDRYFLDEVLSALGQHQYPPRPDMPARAKNMQRRRELESEIKKISDRAYEVDALREEREKRTGVKPERDRYRKIVDEFRKEMDAAAIRVRECRDELERLETEAPKLVLPR